MKSFTCLTAAACLLACSAYAGGQDLSRYDLSTDEGVNAAREAISGEKLDEYSKNCIRRNSDLPRVVAVGGFAFDLGCRFQGVFVDSHYFEKDDAALSTKALDALGWKTASREQRERLARLWVESGLLPFNRVLAQRNKDFQNRPFQSPQVVSKNNGEVIVTLWIGLPPGMRRGRGYQLLEYRFSTDGDLSGSSTLENLSL